MDNASICDNVLQERTITEKDENSNNDSLSIQQQSEEKIQQEIKTIFLPIGSIHRNTI